MVKKMWKIFVKILRKLNPSSFKVFSIVKFLIYLLFIYQLIQLIMDYTKYEMTNEYLSEHHLEDISYTFCIEQDKLLSIDSLFLLKYEYINGKDAFFMIKRSIGERYCYSYYTNKNYTYVFHNKITSFTVKKFILHFEKYPFTINIIPHPNKAPSHFGKSFLVKPKKLILTSYYGKTEYSIRKLLPWPFEHNCYDYESPTSKFQSREYCYLDVMSKLELKYCKVNKYWTILNDFDKNITQCIKPNFTLLNMFCKIDCLDILLEYSISKLDLQQPTSEESYQIIFLDQNINNERLILKYSPKFTKMQLLSTMGGLLGMWLGLSIKNLIIKFFEIIYRFYTKLKFSVSRFQINKIRPCIILIIILLMTYNLYELIIEYLSENTITKIIMVNKVDFPNMMILEQFFSANRECENYFNKLLNNYPNILQILFKNYPQLKVNYGNNFDLYRTFQKAFLREIIHEYGYEYFHGNIFPDIVTILTCSIIYKNETIVNCKNIYKVFMGKQELNFSFILHFPRTLFHEKINVNSIRKIILEYNVDKCFQKSVFILENHIPKYSLTFNSESEATVKFQKVSFPNTNIGCIDNQYNQTYDIVNCQMKFLKNILINNFKLD